MPWRGNAGAYEVAVSEFMLQQTQVERVLPLYARFLKRFPDWRALARSPQAAVVRAWQGLGYNMRAVRLRAMAEEIVDRFGGRLPEDDEALRSLKGIGPYTARALCVFVHHQPLLAPDTNIRRVLNRLFRGPSADPKEWNEARWARWEKTLPPRRAYDLNQALMDLGATVCVAGTPRCPECPVRNFCASYPKILAMPRHRLPAQKHPKKERVDAHGIPDRIYRGRVIERLRSGPAVRSELLDIARADIIVKLERDGLVETAGKAVRLA